MKIINNVFQNEIHGSLITDKHIYKMDVLQYRNLLNSYKVYMFKKIQI